MVENNTGLFVFKIPKLVWANVDFSVRVGTAKRIPGGEGAASRLHDVFFSLFSVLHFASLHTPFMLFTEMLIWMAFLFAAGSIFSPRFKTALGVIHGYAVFCSPTENSFNKFTLVTAGDDFKKFKQDPF